MNQVVPEDARRALHDWRKRLTVSRLQRRRSEGANTSRSWPSSPISLFTSAIAVLGLTACVAPNGVYFHDDARAKLATASQTDWKAVDGTSVVTAEQTNLKALLAAELSTQDDLAQSIRNHHLRSFIALPLVHPLAKEDAAGLVAGDGLQDLIRAQLLALLGNDYLKLGKTPDGSGEYHDIVGVLDDRMRKLSAQTVDWNTRLNKLKTQYTVSYKADKLPLPPACSDVPGAKTGKFSHRIDAALSTLSSDDRDVAQQDLEDMRVHVCGVEIYEPDPAKAFGDGGALGAAYSDYQNALIEKESAKEAEAVMELEFQDAKKTYDDEVKKNSKTNIPDLQAAVAGHASRLKSAISALEQASKATGGRSDIFLSKERLGTLADFVDTVTQGLSPSAVASAASSASPSASAASAPVASASASASSAVADTVVVPAGASKPSAAIILLSGLVTDARKMQAERKSPLNLPFQLYRDQEQLKLSASTLALRSKQSQIVLAKRLVDTLTEEVQQLYLAEKALQKYGGNDADAAGGQPTEKKGSKRRSAAASKAPGTAPQTFQQEYAAASPEKKVQLLMAAQDYLFVVGHLEPQRYKLQYMSVAAMNDESLAYSAVNIKRWQSLIQTSVDQVSDYYEGGINPEALASLLQAMSLVAIGVGVNK